MSLQRFEGFDHFDDVGPVPADFLAKGMSTSSGTILSYSAGKFSGFAVGLANTAYSFAIPYTTAVTESFIGFWSRQRRYRQALQKWWTTTARIPMPRSLT